MISPSDSQYQDQERRRFVELVRPFLSTDQLKLDEKDLAHWGTDWTRAFKVDPLAIALPSNIDQVVELVRTANKHDYRLVPSGGRTGLSGGCVASNREVVVSFDRMNRILGFNSVDQTVSCEAGVVTAQLQEYAQQHGMFYPVDFSSSGSSQIGGNIATNAGGIRVIRYGMTRDWVAGLTVVTGGGDVMKLNRGLVKNATGFDLRHLFIGSEGTLGVIVEAELKLRSQPLAQQVMVLCVDQLEHLLAILERFRRAVDLSAFEFFSEFALSRVIEHRHVQRPMESKSNYYALLEYDQIQDAEAFVAFEDCVNQGWVREGVISHSEAQAQALWTLRDGITESIADSTPYKNDTSVRISEVPGFLADVDAVVNKHYPDLDVCWFGHIGDGNLHLNILKPSSIDIDEFQERCRSINPLLFGEIAKRGGSISAEHGVGLLKRDYLEYSRSTEEIEAMLAIKRVLDPNGIMNPGKLINSE